MLCVVYDKPPRKMVLKHALGIILWLIAIIICPRFIQFNNEPPDTQCGAQQHSHVPHDIVIEM